MRKIVGVVFGTLMVMLLASYGMQAYARQTKGYDLAAAMEAREMQVVRSLGLTQQQMNQFLALKAELKEKNKPLANRRDVELGKDINKWWRTSLQQTFTPAQYQKYVDAYRMPAGSYKFSMDFKGMELAVVEQLGLSANQKQRFTAHLAYMDALNAERRIIVQERADAWTIANKDKEISVAQHKETQEIMTPEQYAHYVCLWQDIMNPALENSNRLAEQGIRARGR